MSLSFWFKKPQKKDIDNTHKDGIAKSIANNTTKIQGQCAAFLQGLIEKLPDRVKKVLLAIFFLLSSGYSLHLIIKSLMQQHKGKSLLIEPIRIQKNTGKVGDENTKATVTISEGEYKKIHRFKIYMDSLAQYPLGRLRYDSILSRRPGLMDSIVIIQELYKERN